MPIQKSHKIQDKDLTSEKNQQLIRLGGNFQIENCRFFYEDKLPAPTNYISNNQ